MLALAFEFRYDLLILKPAAGSRLLAQHLDSSGYIKNYSHHQLGDDEKYLLRHLNQSVTLGNRAQLRVLGL